MADDVQAESFVSIPREDSIPEELLESGMLGNLQAIGSRLIELGGAFAGGTELTPEDLQALRREKPILMPVVIVLSPLIAETREVAEKLVNMTNSMTEGRRTRKLLIFSVMNKEHPEMVKDLTKEYIEAWQRGQPELQEVHRHLAVLASKWGTASDCTTFAKERMGERVHAAQHAYQQMTDHRWAQTHRAGVAGICGVLVIGVAGTFLVAIYLGNVDIAKLVSGISTAVGAIAWAMKWDPRVEEGILAAAAKVREAIKMEKELAKVLELLNAVKRELDDLTSAVGTQTEIGYRAKAEAEHEEQEGSRDDDLLVAFERTLNLATTGAMSADEVQQFLIEKRDERPTQMQMMYDSLEKAVARGRQLSQQLGFWKDNCERVEAAMERLKKHMLTE